MIFCVECQHLFSISGCMIVQRRCEREIHLTTWWISSGAMPAVQLHNNLPVKRNRIRLQGYTPVRKVNEPRVRGHCSPQVRGGKWPTSAQQSAKNCSTDSPIRPDLDSKICCKNLHLKEVDTYFGSFFLKKRKCFTLTFQNRSLLAPIRSSHSVFRLQGLWGKLCNPGPGVFRLSSPLHHAFDFCGKVNRCWTAGMPLITYRRHYRPHKTCRQPRRLGGVPALP